jgi:hypothetical protein
MVGAGAGSQFHKFTLTEMGELAHSANPGGVNKSGPFEDGLGCGPYVTFRCRVVVKKIRRRF